MPSAQFFVGHARHVAPGVVAVGEPDAAVEPRRVIEAVFEIMP